MAARALDAEVKSISPDPVVRWLVVGVAEAAVARFYACGMAQAAWVGTEECLRADAGAADATLFVVRTLDPVRTLVY
jgi:uncharacterized protein